MHLKYWSWFLNSLTIFSIQIGFLMYKWPADKFFALKTHVSLYCTSNQQNLRREADIDRQHNISGPISNPTYDPTSDPTSDLTSDPTSKPTSNPTSVLRLDNLSTFFEHNFIIKNIQTTDFIICSAHPTVYTLWHFEHFDKLLKVISA